MLVTETQGGGASLVMEGPEEVLVVSALLAIGAAAPFVAGGDPIAQAMSHSAVIMLSIKLSGAETVGAFRAMEPERFNETLGARLRELAVVCKQLADISERHTAARSLDWKAGA